MGLNFFVYEHSMSLQKELQKKFDVEASGELAKMGLSGLCGALAGGLSKLLMFPLDTIKKRLQAQVLFNTMMHHPTAPAGMQHTLVKGSHHVGEYDGVCHCISGVYAREGVTGFYKVSLGDRSLYAHCCGQSGVIEVLCEINLLLDVLWNNCRECRALHRL